MFVLVYKFGLSLVTRSCMRVGCPAPPFVCKHFHARASTPEQVILFQHSQVLYCKAVKL